MNKFRLWMIGFVLVLTLFFNIERLDFGEENIIDISSFAYVLGLAGVLLTFILLPRFRVNVVVGVLGWGIAYLVFKFIFSVFFDGRPLIGGVYTYLTITEAALISVVIFFTYKLAAALQEFEDAVEKVTFSTVANRRIKRLEDADEEIQLEMFRSRNHHHSLGVVVVAPEAKSFKDAMNRMVQGVQQDMMRNYVVHNMAHMLSKYLRRTDMILEQRDQGRFIILCPETQLSDLDQLVDHIRAVMHEKLGVTITCGTANFPDEALTFDELVHQAESRLQIQQQT